MYSLPDEYFLVDNNYLSMEDFLDYHEVLHIVHRFFHIYYVNSIIGEYSVHIKTDAKALISPQFHRKSFFHRVDFFQNGV